WVRGEAPPARYHQFPPVLELPLPFPRRDTVGHGPVDEDDPRPRPPPLDVQIHTPPRVRDRARPYPQVVRPAAAPPVASVRAKSDLSSPGAWREGQPDPPDAEPVPRGPRLPMSSTAQHPAEGIGFGVGAGIVVGWP